MDQGQSAGDASGRNVVGGRAEGSAVQNCVDHRRNDRCQKRGDMRSERAHGRRHGSGRNDRRGNANHVRLVQGMNAIIGAVQSDIAF